MRGLGVSRCRRKLLSWTKQDIYRRGLNRAEIVQIVLDKTGQKPKLMDNTLSQPGKDWLKQILHAHCLTHTNYKRVLKHVGIAESVFCGLGYDAVADKILSLTNEDRARDIVNAMPFPFIETAVPVYTQERDSWYWIENVLADLKDYGEIMSITGNGIAKIKH